MILTQTTHQIDSFQIIIFSTILSFVIYLFFSIYKIYSIKKKNDVANNDTPFITATSILNHKETAKKTEDKQSSNTTLENKTNKTNNKLTTTISEQDNNIFVKENKTVNNETTKNKTVTQIIHQKPIIEQTIKEEQSKPKYIGYNPINIFTQTEPLNYPYVIMPKNKKCIIKFARKGRNGRKGYKEDSFYNYLQKYFKKDFQIYNDRFILTKKNTIRYEPDFTIIDEKKDINIFMDIEIDEPYEGLNDINQRNITHCQYYDTNRNNEFRNRGWVVVRFSEIQIHQNPDSCCRFIADVIRSINPDFNYPDSLLNTKKITPIRQWTKKEAKLWSIQKYRENYLGINNFGITDDFTQNLDCTPTEIDEIIEKEVVDEEPLITPKLESAVPSNSNIINEAIQMNKYIAFIYKDSRTIVKPIKYIEPVLTAFCYVKNRELSFNSIEITDVRLKNNYYTQRFISPNLGIKKVADIMNIVIPNQMFVRMKYTRGEWTNMVVNPTTGEIIIDKTEAEESIRTVSNIKLDTEGYGSNYIKTYCHRREEERIFRFDRISELEILDL